MALPDFLVIGAAKAGTVSLYHYLGQHPQIYMCPVNEPNFFALDRFDIDSHFRGPGDRATMERHCVRNLADYEALFVDAEPGQRLGESSPLYLFSAHAPKRIYHYLPQVKLIALLRHPTERAHANYRHYRVAGIEPLSRFEDALDAEAQRVAQGWGPWPFWAYRAAGDYARQLQRYYALFDQEQILICFHEELREDAVALLQKIYGFVGVDSTFAPDTSVRHNVGNRPRLRLLQRLMTRPNRLKTTLKRALPERARIALRETLRGLNEARLALDPNTRKQLNRAYRPGIEALERLTDKDLRRWWEE